MSSTKATLKTHILESAPSYTYFREEHLERNVPCLIAPDLISEWPAISLETSSATPNWKYIREQYGNEVVSVAQCGLRAFSDQEREERPLREVIDLWTSGAGEGLYVKDWHLAKSVRERGAPMFYKTPDIFRDDWMNSFWEEEGRDDFRFVYMGVAGTFTPLHRDVYTSYSWSTNIVGTKIWRLFPPSVAHLLRRDPERTSSEIVYDVRQVDHTVFRGFSEACREMVVVEQHPGWTIFVPSGWYHQVENVTDAISINHNWCNIANLPSMYTSLVTAVVDVEHALEDVHILLRTRSGNADWEREWIEVVQDVLRKDSGWELSLASLLAFARHLLTDYYTSWMTFWRMIAHNVGQLKDPPPIENCVWPTPPASLRPSFTYTKTVVHKLVDEFLKTRALDVKYIAGLPETLGTLNNLLSSS